jgi:hypothetical protein
MFNYSIGMRWKAIEAIKALQTNKEKPDVKNQDFTVLSSASWMAISHFVGCLVTGVLVFNIPPPEFYPISYSETYVSSIIYRYKVNNNNN